MVQNALFMPKANWIPPKTFPNPKAFTYINVDVETYDPNIKEYGPGWATGDGELVGFSIADNEGNAWYFPMRHRGGGNLPEEQCTKFLHDLMRTDVPKRAFNALYDFGWIQYGEGIKVNGELHDPMFGAALVDEYRSSYSLDALCRSYKLPTKDDTLLQEAAKAIGLEPGAAIAHLHSKYVGAYGEQDAIALRDIGRVIDAEIEQQELQDVYRLECDLIPLLLMMRATGVRVNEEANEKLRDQTEYAIRTMHSTLKREHNMRIDVNSSTSLAKVCERLKVPYSKTDLGNPSFDAKWLDRQDHPVFKLVREIRKRETLISLVCNGMMKYVRNGRIHCELHPLRRDDETMGQHGGTVTGRFSCSRPNLQQVPKRDEELGPLCRSLFLPDERQMWCSNDYSQQEYRLLVHFANRIGARGAAEAVAAYKADPHMSFHNWVHEQTGLPYALAKNLNFGVAYGQGARGIARTYNFSLGDAQKFLRTYHDSIEFVRPTSLRASEAAQERGYVKTILGRRARFPLWEPRQYTEGMQPVAYATAVIRWGKGIKRAHAHKALNRIIQGSGADMIKRAMLDIYNSGLGHLLRLQVHDELNASLHTYEQAKQLQELMANAIPLDVPVLVESKTGETW